jgi:hypothetical protein
MLNNVVFRRAARPVRARIIGLVAWAGMAWPPVAVAAETAAPTPNAPFENYQGWRDEPLQDWRRVNERVGEIGGWRTYLREAQPEGGAGQDAPGHPGHHGH